MTKNNQKEKSQEEKSLRETSLLVGNWKMHGTRAKAMDLALAIKAGVSHPGVIVCPAFAHLEAVGRILADSVVGLGGQDCHHTTDDGPHTGDVSAAMLKDIGAEIVILGHSERRTNHGESDDLIAAKLLAARAARLRPILCVGETKDQREAGEEIAVVTAQIKAAQKFAPFGERDVIAYEPVWAIGTGLVATEEDIRAMHAHIRDLVGPAMPILYGGSVKPNNILDLRKIENVNGALVGGASLDAGAFLALALALAKV
ncbi:MAG: triose-phosphate isomerase [Pseudomonadota bacterium]